MEESLTLNQHLLLRPLTQPLLQIIRNPLPLELGLLGLQSGCRRRVEQDVAVLEVLGLGPVLEVLLEGAAALEGGCDGRRVDAGVGGGLLVGHVLLSLV